MKISFSEHDEFGNSQGVIIPLRSDITPKQILAIGNYYKKIGWKPSQKTKRVLEDAKKVIKRKSKTTA